MAHKLKPNDPMPCGFIRKGVNLKKRLAHYRACPHPACGERDMAARTMAAKMRDGLAQAQSYARAVAIGMSQSKRKG